MALSPNYGWAEPDNSSLVKNGAQDIRALGDAIDTSLWNVGYGQAGKNKVINGNFGVWQRGTSITTGTAGTYVYTADRWLSFFYGTNTSSVTQQTFTPGAAPVAGYEGQFFGRFTSTSTANFISYRVEDVRTLAGQTATLSFWAKSASAQNLTTSLTQSFGSGGSGNVGGIISGTAALTTSWQRFTFTASIPSISGKIVGTSSYVLLEFVGAINNAVDLWGMQLEYGSKATPFQTASGGSPQAELAMCQRYYYRMTSAGGDAYTHLFQGMGISSTQIRGVIQFPVAMRAVYPTVDYGGSLIGSDGTATLTGGAVTAQGPGQFTTGINLAVTGATQYRPYYVLANNSNSTYIGFSTEL
jgi:hypothetical protein